MITSKDYNRVFAIGYNGNHAGGPNLCDSEEAGNCGCFPPNVHVTTENGPKKIQYIKKGEKVLTHMGRWRSVTDTLKRNKQERSFTKIWIRCKPSYLVATDDHPVLVKDGNKMKWIPMCKLQIGDIVLCSTVDCQSCGKTIAKGRKTCNICFKKSSKGEEFRKRASERMKRDNPMQRLYRSEIVDGAEDRVKSLVEKQKQGQKLLKEKLFNHAKKLEQSTGFRAVVVDHIGLRPDIVLIDWNQRKVIAYEYERNQNNVRHDKYIDDEQYDSVVWFVENKTRDDYEIFNGFACLPVTRIKHEVRNTSIYNLEVEEDNSYVCQDVVVHNCLHAEENAIIKLDFNDVTEKILWTTDSPCKMCSKRIINAGIKHVIYAKLYRKTEGIELLLKNSIKVECYDDIFIPNFDLKDLNNTTYSHKLTTEDNK